MLMTSQIGLAYSEGIFIEENLSSNCHFFSLLHFLRLLHLLKLKANIRIAQSLFTFYISSYIHQLKCYTIQQPICNSLSISAYMWHPTQNWYFASMTTALSRKMHYWGTAGKNYIDTWGISCQMSESGMKN